jgi:hypothetical protein
MVWKAQISKISNSGLREYFNKGWPIAASLWACNIGARNERGIEFASWDAHVVFGSDIPI